MKKSVSESGKSFRDGISLFELFEQFPDEESAEKWQENVRWGKEGPECPRCDSPGRVLRDRLASDDLDSARTRGARDQS